MQTAEPQNSSKAKSRYSLSGIIGVVIFSLLTLSGISIILLECYFVNDETEKKIILQLYLLFIILAWFSYTVNGKIRKFLRNLLILCAGCGILFAMMIINPPNLIVSSAGLLLVNAFGIRTIIADSESRDKWEVVFDCIYMVWLITIPIVNLGNNSFFRYSQPLIPEGGQYLLDIRYIITILGLIILTGKVLFDTVRGGVSGADEPLIPTNSDFPLTVAFIGVINAILKAFKKTVNFFQKIGSNYARYFIELKSLDFWFSFGKIIYTFLTVILVGLIVRYIHSPISFYLENEVVADWSGNLLNFIFITLFFLFVVASIPCICIIWRIENFDNRFGNAIALTTTAWWFSGVLILFFRLITKIEINGFTFPSIYTILFLLLVISGVWGEIAGFIKSKAGVSDSDSRNMPTPSQLESKTSRLTAFTAVFRKLNPKIVLSVIGILFLIIITTISINNAWSLGNEKIKVESKVNELQRKLDNSETNAKAFSNKLGESNREVGNLSNKLKESEGEVGNLSNKLKDSSITVNKLSNIISCVRGNGNLGDCETNSNSNRSSYSYSNDSSR